MQSKGVRLNEKDIFFCLVFSGEPPPHGEKQPNYGELLSNQSKPSDSSSLRFAGKNKQWWWGGGEFSVTFVFWTSGGHFCPDALVFLFVTASFKSIVCAPIAITTSPINTKQRPGVSCSSGRLPQLMNSLMLVKEKRGKKNKVSLIKKNNDQ